MLTAGLVTALASAVPGAIDFFSIPSRTRAKRIGFLHGLGNLLVTGLFAASWLKTPHSPNRLSIEAVSLSTAGATLGLVTGWLGGELVDTLGIGVHEHANVDAPSSLSGPSHSAASIRPYRPAAIARSDNGANSRRGRRI